MQNYTLFLPPLWMLLSFALLIHSQPLVLSDANMELHFDGNTPSFTLVSPNSSFYLDFNIQSVAEYTPSNTLVHLENIPQAITNYSQWTLFNNFTNNIISIQQLIFDSSFSNGGEFHVIFWLATFEESLLSLNTTEILVFTNLTTNPVVLLAGYSACQTLCELVKWPFNSTSNILKISLEVQTNASPFDASVTDTPVEQIVELPFSSSLVDIQTHIFKNGTVDNYTRSLDINYNIDGIDPITVDLVLTIPSFNYSGTYAPLIVTVPSIHRIPWLAIIIGVGTGLVVCCGLGGGVFFVWRYYKKQQKQEFYQFTEADTLKHNQKEYHAKVYD